MDVNICIKNKTNGRNFLPFVFVKLLNKKLNYINLN